MTISRSVLLRMRNVSDKNCRENQKKAFYVQQLFSERRSVCEIIWKNIGRARQVTGENTCITHRIRTECWITMATDIHSEYAIFIAFPLQQWLRERATMLRCTYIVLLPLPATEGLRTFTAARQQ